MARKQQMQSNDSSPCAWSQLKPRHGFLKLIRTLIQPSKSVRTFHIKREEPNQPELADQKFGSHKAKLSVRVKDPVIPRGIRAA